MTIEESHVTSVEDAGQSRRCAVIYNPTKISDKFRALWRKASSERAGATRCGWRHRSRIQAEP